MVPEGDVLNHRVLGVVFGIVSLAHAGCGGESPVSQRRGSRPTTARAFEAPSRRSPTSPVTRSFDFTSGRSSRSSKPGTAARPRTARTSARSGMPSGTPRPPTAPGFARATWIAPGRSSSRGSPRPTARSPSPGSLCRPGGMPSGSIPSTFSCTGCGTWRRTASGIWPIPSRIPGPASPSRTAIWSPPGAGETSGIAASPRRTSGSA